MDPQLYLSAAVAALEAEKELLTRLDWMAIVPKTIVDVGCGFGHATLALQQRYPTAHLTAVDYQMPCLQHMQSQSQEANLVCADANTSLPFKDGSIDLIFANFLLPWLSRGARSFSEWRRLLSPNGLLMFTALGPDTFKELMPFLPQTNRAVFPFYVEDMHELGDALLQAQLTDPVLDINYLTIKYQQAEQLIMDLQHSELLPASLASSILQQIVNQATTIFPLRLTYELIFATAFAPVTLSQVHHDNGEVSIAMQTLRQMLKKPKI